MVRPLKAATVSSTKPDSLSVSEWMATWVSVSSATLRQVSMAEGVVPQSSCSFRPMAPAAICSRSGAGWLALPLPRKPRFIGKASAAFQHQRDVVGAGRAGGGKGAGGRAGAAADHGGHAAVEGFFDLLRADEVDVGVDAAGRDDHAFGGDDLGAGADDDVHAGLHIGVAGLADGDDAPGLDADVGLDDAPVVEDQGVGEHGVARRPLRQGRWRWLWPMPSRMVLPPPNFTSSP